MVFITIDSTNWLAAIALRPKRSQYRIIRRDAVLYSLAKAFVSRPGEYAPHVIGHQGQLVGAIRIRNYGHGIGFASFFIDRKHQGKGLGRMALEHLLGVVVAVYPDAQEVETAVHPANTKARSLYESLGFRYTGAVSKDGILDMELPLPWKQKQDTIRLEASST